MFEDHNSTIIEELDSTYHVSTLEMETFHLYVNFMRSY